MSAKYIRADEVLALLQYCTLQHGLSLQATGILAFLASTQSHTTGLTYTLCNQFGISGRTLWKYINELKRCGVLKIKALRNRHGQFVAAYGLALVAPDGVIVHECVFVERN
ncbi:helix-turn-helix domain-containing protein [Helicobacter ailurogastricus]|uniref:helix-turn-helix domain-containing protein n=1 Tax=Helicobacter ailurogastricus TaxID=1578720 RepID=UPI001315A9DB|nr:helix-turn-helix domain-containing protein [Helicobacter ailurogastricus]